ncbi:hypothetical protein ACOSQ3_015264 [Xanthoceras sorbifolium]
MDFLSLQLLSTNHGERRKKKKKADPNHHLAPNSFFFILSRFCCSLDISSSNTSFCRQFSKTMETENNTVKWGSFYISFVSGSMHEHSSLEDAMGERERARANTCQSGKDMIIFYLI